LYGFNLNNPINMVDPEGDNPVAVAAGPLLAGGPPGWLAYGLIVGSTTLAIYAGYQIYSSQNAPSPGSPSRPQTSPSNAQRIPGTPAVPLAAPKPMEMAKGGPQNISNEYSETAKHLYPKDPKKRCEYLEELYKKTCDSSERQKIKKAQKALGCRKNSQS
jgi:hypothetical protein